jgi:adenine-specific DNA methylase
MALPKLAGVWGSFLQPPAGISARSTVVFSDNGQRSSCAVRDWAHEVCPALQTIVAARVDELSQLGIKGTDLVIAPIGARMHAYTRFERVEKPTGEELAPGEYLDEVQREVVEAILSRIFGTDRGGLGPVDQETQLYVMRRFEFGSTEVPWDELNTLPRGTGVELAAETHSARLRS